MSVRVSRAGGASRMATLGPRVRHAVNQRLPDRPVKRTIRGIDMIVPRHHALPYFAAPGSPYGANLVELARLLAAAEGRVNFLDVGANIGDTALFVLDQVTGSAVCVEPDPQWQRYLRLNVGTMSNVAIEQAVLLAPTAGAGPPLQVVRDAFGSSRLEQADGPAGLATLSTDELLARHPQLATVRLIKTDTDGYDVMLAPALARTFAASRPLIFLEYSPSLTQRCTPELVARDLWPILIDLGYERAVVWDNQGFLLGASPTEELVADSAVLEDQRARTPGYWDVAVAHRDDPVGLDVLDAVVNASRTR